MLGESSFQPYAINTFSHRGKQFKTEHFISANHVSSYIRKDGTFVKGYWRDGDGDTSINRDGGYFSRNLGPVPQVIKKGGKA